MAGPVSIFASLLALTLSAWAWQVSAAGFAVKPAPSWVQMVPVSPSEKEFKSEGSGAVCLLSDQQTRVTASGVERFYRTVNSVSSAAGLNEVSQLEFDFEPTYQKLVIHFIQIRRGDAIINALRPSEIKVIQKEEELKQRLYNGTMSALVFLNDVRAGDVIDCAYSINGDNPVMGGKYADNVLLWSNLPAQKVRWRLLWPSSRALLHRTQNIEEQPSIKQSNGETEYVWERTAVTDPEYATDAPGWFNQFPTVEVTEFANWGEVVSWAKPLYEVKRPLSQAFSSQVEKWRNSSGASEGRLLAALRFTQDEIRYTGIELGTYSHKPTQPSVVCARRFGDCKDKSLLLVTALNELGIEAYPALVNTTANSAVSAEQPSPYAFNHVIVRAALDGKVYWFDPTISLQRGALAEHQNPPYGRALVIRAGDSELEEVPLDNETPTTELKRIYIAPGQGNHGSLDVVTTYRRSDADRMRYALTQQSLSDLTKSRLLRNIVESESQIESEGPIDVRDDPDSNTVVTTERYKISDFWQDQHRDFYATHILREVSTSAHATGSAPRELEYPLYVNETIEVHLPGRPRITPDSGSVVTDSLDFRYSVSSSGNIVTMVYQLRHLRDHVPADSIARHSEAVNKIQNTASYALSNDGGEGGGRVSSGFSTSTYLPLLIVFGPLVLFGLLKALKGRQLHGRRDEFRHKMQVPPGATPEMAIQLGSMNDLATRLAEFPCSCGARYSVTEENLRHETVTYGGRRVAVVSLKCERCERPKDLYFTPGDMTSGH